MNVRRHWVLKPANSLRWYREVIGWLDQWAKAEGFASRERRIHSGASDSRK